MNLSSKIKSKEAAVAVIGMGYVGLPLMLQIAKCGFQVKGIDTDKTKVWMINKGKSYIEYIEDEEIKAAKLLEAQDNYTNIEDFDIIIICVPTPVTKNKDPDLSCIISAVNQLKSHLRNGQMIILESSTFPGTTEEIVLPILSESGLKVGEDYYLAFSPERVDPGNKEYTIENTPKIVSGVTQNCCEIACSFYSQFIDYVYKTSSTRVAEMAKLFENTFRNVNIALVNQLSLLCNKMGIDSWEVIEAAATKPFGFMPFYPGPGIGGHCIPVDPLYLIWKAKEYDFSLSLVETANQINNEMPWIVVGRVQQILNTAGKALKNSKVLLLGVSYKKDISDCRESPALKVIKGLLDGGCTVLFNDPYVREVNVDNQVLFSQELSTDLLSKCDCTVILTPHKVYDLNWIIEHSNLVFDTRNSTENFTKNSKIIKL